MTTVLGILTRWPQVSTNYTIFFSSSENDFSFTTQPSLFVHNAHLGNSCRERRSHFAVYFIAGFNNKTVPCTMNELYLTGATREAENA